MTIVGRLQFEPIVTGLPEALILGPLTLGQVDAIRIEAEGLANEMRAATSGEVTGTR